MRKRPVVSFLNPFYPIQTLAHGIMPPIIGDDLLTSVNATSKVPYMYPQMFFS